MYLITYEGITDTFTGWARRIGIARTTLYKRRITCGWSVRKTLTTPLLKGAALAEYSGIPGHRKRLIEIDGITDSVAGHARRYKVNQYTAHKRLACGCSPRRAFTAPKGAREEWLVWEVKFITKHLDRPCSWLAEHLPRHSIEGVRHRRRLLRRQLSAQESTTDG